MIDKNIHLDFQIEHNEGGHTDLYKSLMNYLENSILPSPDRLSFTGGKETDISGFMDKKVLKKIEKGRYVVELLNKKMNTIVTINQRRFDSSMFIKIPIDLLETLTDDDVVKLFEDLIKNMSPEYAFCHIDVHANKLSQEHYMHDKRTFYASGLYWLNYFGQEEIEQQGGEALLENPYCESRKIHNGIFLKVSESLQEVTSAKGEELLLNATKAMPPIN